MTNENHSLSEPLVVFWNRFRTLLSSPIDAASLAVFRICLGLVMVYEAYRYLIPKNGVNRIQSLFSQDHWHFPYHGFEWVTPMSETGMHLLFWGLGIVGAMVAVGLFYRAAATLMFLAFTYIFLLDAALYLNHFYLICLLSFLLIWLPANHCWSVDAWWKRRKQGKSLSGVPLASSVPGRRETLATENTGKAGSTLSSDSLIPFWPVFLLRAQLFIVYFYAGIAKLNADWLGAKALKGAHQKVFDFLNGNSLIPAWIEVKHVGLWMNWSGAIFDLSIGFLLICRRTRLLGILSMLTFHTINHFTFPIGVFPVMAFATSMIFCDPDWPRCVWAWIRKPRFAKPDRVWLIGGALAVPVLGAALAWKRKTQPKSLPESSHRLRGFVIGFVCIWLVAQAMIPLRHSWIDGNPEWTEEHHRFSWRMMLKSKSAVDIKFDINDPHLLAMDADGKPTIKWQNWPETLPRAMHIDVDAHHVPWNQLPNLVFLYEPCVGVRVIDNPLARSNAGGISIDERSEKIREHWSKTFGRIPHVHPAVSLKDALNSLRSEFSNLARNSDSDAELLNTHISAIDRIVEIQGNSKRTVADMIEFSDLLQIMTNSAHGEYVQQHLLRTHPFSVQGAGKTEHTFLVIEDPQLDQQGLSVALSKLNGDKPYSVLVDTRRLRYDGWHSLPKAMMLVENGLPRLVWNCFSDLHQKQIENMTKRPYMAHQYARHVADSWESETGRSAGVHVTAVAQLNEHKPQLLIDPSIDLARTSISLIGHNDWVYQLDSPAAQGHSSSVAQPPSPNRQMTPRDRNSKSANRKIVEHHANGQPKQGIQWSGGNREDYIVVKWHENGQIALLAEYKNNQPHGKQTKWRADGTMILEMHFENGKPHGLATSWDESGKLAEKAQFIEGRQVNFEEKSKASAIPATAERTGSNDTESSTR